MYVGFELIRVYVIHIILRDNQNNSTANDCRHIFITYAPHYIACQPVIVLFYKCRGVFLAFACTRSAIIYSDTIVRRLIYNTTETILLINNIFLLLLIRL